MKYGKTSFTMKILFSGISQRVIVIDENGATTYRRTNNDGKIVWEEPVEVDPEDAEWLENAYQNMMNSFVCED